MRGRWSMPGGLLGSPASRKGGVWERVARDTWGQGEVRQLLVPFAYQAKILRFAHKQPWAGHLGTAKMLARVLERFFWPAMHPEVKQYCRSCPLCQQLFSQLPERAPLKPLPIMDHPFQRIAMDFVGPLPRMLRDF